MDLIEEYKQEILGKISDLKNANDDEEIMALVKEYEDKIRKEYACLCELQKREEEAEKAKGEFNPTENIGETTTV